LKVEKQKQIPSEKTNLHPRNKHRGQYDFKSLINASQELEEFVRLNDYDNESIDFFNPAAVKALNTALLKLYYNIDYWNIPKNYLCPPIPGRADYIHYMADVLSESNKGIIPKGASVKCLDIGMGANCIYPIIGNSEYGWSFVGTDVDSVAIESARNIIEKNPTLKGQIELRLQTNKNDIFNNIIYNNERFDLVICNPPFHGSLAEAQIGTHRKLSNLKQKKITKPILNFGGNNTELWYEGGEKKFVRLMIEQSIIYKKSCLWFSCLISKEANLEYIYKLFEKAAVPEVQTIPMGQGNKISRIVAWTFQTAQGRS